MQKIPLGGARVELLPENVSKLRYGLNHSFGTLQTVESVRFAPDIYSPFNILGTKFSKNTEITYLVTISTYFKTFLWISDCYKYEFIIIFKKNVSFYLEIFAFKAD